MTDSLSEKQWEFVKRFCGLPEAELKTLSPVVGKRLIDLTTACWDRKVSIPPQRTYYRKERRRELSK